MDFAHYLLDEASIVLHLHATYLLLTSAYTTVTHVHPLHPN